MPIDSELRLAESIEQIVANRLAYIDCQKKLVSSELKIASLLRKKATKKTGHALIDIRIEREKEVRDVRLRISLETAKQIDLLLDSVIS